MSGFRKPYNLIRLAPGAYVNGEWVPGTSSVIAMQATIQPMTGEDQFTLPEGRRLGDYIKVYTATAIQPVNETTGQQPDRLEWRGHTYECVQVDVRQMDVIPHYKAVFSKVSQA